MTTMKALCYLLYFTWAFSSALLDRKARKFALKFASERRLQHKFAATVMADYWLECRRYWRFTWCWLAAFVLLCYAITGR